MLSRSTLPSLIIKNKIVKYPIVQGGMGIGVSNFRLAGSVSREGGLGVISSAALDRVVSTRIGSPFNAREAAAREVRDAREIAPTGIIGINIMVAVVEQYADSILGAMDGGVDVIISGAGLPLKLPLVVATHPRRDEVALIPIVSSGRALKIIIKKWGRHNCVPDAVVVEGPLAGGHIGWSSKNEACATENCLENLVTDVLRTLEEENLKIPVIAAGGIYSHQDIKKFIAMGCSGVQMGTRFLATVESGASEEYKQQVVACSERDIYLADTPGSPCKLLFRVIKNCPFYMQALKQERSPKCDKGYLLIDGKCAAKDSFESFCICNGLLSSANTSTSNGEGLYTVGANAFMVDKILPVKTLMEELV
ncbi:MAG: nitronate monooxygenase [Oligoflexia bacterium]|nr:nitronate monooxygenase [Oligoflexia bacterium]